MTIEQAYKLKRDLDCWESLNDNDKISLFNTMLSPRYCIVGSFHDSNSYVISSSDYCDKCDTLGRLLFAEVLPQKVELATLEESPLYMKYVYDPTRTINKRNLKVLWAEMVDHW